MDLMVSTAIERTHNSKLCDVSSILTPVTKLYLNMEKNWIYIGIFLEESSKCMLRQFYQIPEDWKEYYDHVTITFNDGSELSRVVKEMNRDNIGEFYTFKVTGIGVSEKALALRVELPTFVVCSNKIPHITLGVAPNATPVESNNITIWYDSLCTANLLLLVVDTI